MVTTAEHMTVPPVRRSPLTALRLRLKLSHRWRSLVQRVIDRVRYDQNDWSPKPPSFKHQGTKVTLASSRDSSNAITVCRPQFGRLTVLPAPTCTDMYTATATATAASVGNASSPDQLLGTSQQGAKEGHLSPIPLQRWRPEKGLLRWSCRGPTMVMDPGGVVVR